MMALPMVHAASLHTHGGAVGCVVDGWRYYGGVAGVVGGACCKLALLFVGYGVAGVVNGVAGCWRSHGSVVGGACCKLALLFVVYGVAGVVDGVAGCWCSYDGVADGACCKLAHSTN